MIDQKRAKFLSIFFTSILALDVLTKWMTHTFLNVMQRGMLPYPYGGLRVFENFYGISFSINHQTNTGAAWGLFPNSQKILLLGRIAVIIILAIYVVFFSKNRRSQIPFTMIISGALGNVLDSLFYGHVIDLFFFQFWGYDFPVFNIADSFIFIGVAWLCLINLKADSPQTVRSFSHESKPFNSSSFK